MHTELLALDIQKRDFKIFQAYSFDTIKPEKIYFSRNSFAVQLRPNYSFFRFVHVNDRHIVYMHHHFIASIVTVYFSLLIMIFYRRFII